MATAEEKESRQRAILRMLEEDPLLTTQDLASTFCVSLGTVRNDLVALEELGNIRRSYGRIELLARHRRDTLLAIPDRFSRPARTVGERILSRLRLMDRIFLDDSEVSHYVARRLPDNQELHVLTNSIRVAATLAWRDHPGEITLLPGRVRRKDLSVAVDLGDLLPGRYRAGAAFCEISGIDGDSLCYAATRDDLELIRIASRCSDSIYLHLNPEGVGRSDLHVVPVAEFAERLVEIMIDDSALSLVKELRAEALPLIVVGDDYSLAGPFGRREVVGFAAVDVNHEYPQTIQKSIEEAVRASGGIELIVTDSHGDREKTLENIDTFIRNDARVVIEYSPLEEIGTLAVEKLSHSGIVMIGVDIPIPGSIYFGVNNYEAGFVAGEMAAEYVLSEPSGEMPEVVLVETATHNQAVISRLQGIEDSIRKRLGIEEAKIRRIRCENDILDATGEIRSALEGSSASEPVIVFGFNAVTTAAACSAVNERTDRNRFGVVGQNLSMEIRRELNRPDTRLIGSVTYHPEQYGTKIVEIVRAILNCEPVGPSYFTRHEWIPASRKQ